MTGGREGCLKTLLPSDILFTQKIITQCFRKDPLQTIEKTYFELLHKKKTVDDIPKITVAQRDGRYWVVNGNRRLYVFKELEKVYGQLGKRLYITVNMITVTDDQFKQVMRTLCDGQSVNILEDQTRGAGSRLRDRMKRISAQWTKKIAEMLMNSDVHITSLIDLGSVPTPYNQKTRPRLASRPSNFNRINPPSYGGQSNPWPSSYQGMQSRLEPIFDACWRPTGNGVPAPQAQLFDPKRNFLPQIGAAENLQTKISYVGVPQIQPIETWSSNKYKINREPNEIDSRTVSVIMESGETPKDTTAATNIVESSGQEKPISEAIAEEAAELPLMEKPEKAVELNCEKKLRLTNEVAVTISIESIANCRALPETGPKQTLDIKLAESKEEIDLNRSKDVKVNDKGGKSEIDKAEKCVANSDPEATMSDEITENHQSAGNIIEHVEKPGPISEHATETYSVNVEANTDPAGTIKEPTGANTEPTDVSLKETGGNLEEIMKTAKANAEVTTQKDPVVSVFNPKADPFVPRRASLPTILSLPPTPSSLTASRSPQKAPTALTMCAPTINEPEMEMHIVPIVSGPQDVATCKKFGLLVISKDRANSQRTYIQYTEPWAQSLAEKFLDGRVSCTLENLQKAIAENRNCNPEQEYQALNDVNTMIQKKFCAAEGYPARNILLAKPNNNQSLSVKAVNESLVNNASNLQTTKAVNTSRANDQAFNRQCRGGPNPSVNRRFSSGAYSSGYGNGYRQGMKDARKKRIYYPRPYVASIKPAPLKT